jgi:hypothetical protein
MKVEAGMRKESQKRKVGPEAERNLERRVEGDEGRTEAGRGLGREG